MNDKKQIYLSGILLGVLLFIIFSSSVLYCVLC